jgi:cyclomaltodextrinase / maltogenic alpha-amylase / neopullulanase
MKLFLIFFAVFYNLNAANYFEENMPDQKDFVPQWAKSAVWYQIFPERFSSGDNSNDPVVESIKGSYPHDHTSPWEVHPWISDWYELQPYEKENGKNIWFNIQRRRYGGDLQGILNKLDYLSELGVTAIYLNPVFWAPSSHKYDAATFHHIDPYFGPDPKGDIKLIESEIPDDPSTWVWTSADKLMLKLIGEIHSRNMRVIFDGVFNHMGINSWVFKDVVKNQQNSKYKDWFAVTSWDDPEKGTKFNYHGWFGVKELPEINEDENGIVEGPKKYIFDITKRWMDPNGDGNTQDGIDGWRLDVAFCVKHQFWKDWRKHVKSINPEAYITAEVIDPIPVLKSYLEGDEFDAVMNYNFAFTSAEFFVDVKNRISVTEFDKRLEELRDAFPACVAYVQQNLFGSHDANRIGSHIVNRDLHSYRNWGKYFEASKGSNPAYDTRKPDEHELKIQKLFTIFQMTYLGAPMIYYGNEAGMWGANDPDCRKPMIWKEFNYDDESVLPDQSKRKYPDEVKFNQDLFDHYKKLIHIRNNNIPLQLGTFKTILTDDEKELYVFERVYRGEKIIVIINNGNARESPELMLDKNSYDDLLNDEKISTKNGKIFLNIPAKWGRILR